MEVECQKLQQKIALKEEESAKITEQLNHAVQEKSHHEVEKAEVKTQITAMEELTVSLTQQAEQKDTEIESLRALLVEKDVELARNLTEFNGESSVLRENLEAEKKNGSKLL